MPLWLNISIALLVFMGLASGGILTLSLMSERGQRRLFTVMFVLTLILAITGGLISSALVPNLPSGLTNAGVLLILSFALGYSLTTFFVLSSGRTQHVPLPPRTNLRGDRTAVILLARGEPVRYSTNTGARRLDLTDDPGDAPPLLLRPFYLRDLRAKYDAVGESPYRQYHLELAEKVQDRLDSRHRVYPAFYSDTPSLSEAVSAAISDGVRHITVLHLRVTDPPDAVMSGDLMEGIEPESYGVSVTHVGPLWLSSLLPQIYVRRVLEVLPQMNAHAEEIGIILVGRGHVGQGSSTQARREQEQSFQLRLRSAMLKLGFGDDRIALAWLRDTPTIASASTSLVQAGAKVIYWMPSTYPSDGINTLYDAAIELEASAAASGVKFVGLGAWNADDLAAEEIVATINSMSESASAVGQLTG